MTLRTFIRAGLAFVCLLLMAVPADAETRNKSKKKAKDPKSTPALQRVPTNVFESIRSKISNVEFFATNYGIFGHDVAGGDPGGFWPRRSNNAYIYGGGVWFGGQKRVAGELKSLSVIGYNPNSGASWMTPGTIDDPSESPTKYRLYFSTDYDPFSGEPLDAADDRAGGPNWPIWDTNPGDTLKYNRYFGFYADDTTMRNRATFPKGPAIVSGEDVFAVYKDTDLGRYSGEDEAGHPFNIQIEQTIYSWGFGPDQFPSTPVSEITRPYKDMIFLKYVIINKSTDTFFNCYMAPAMDMDIGAAANDRNKIVIERAEEDSLNLAVQWSEAESGGKTYGYIGFDFLESPGVDTANFLRKGLVPASEQIGLTTFQNWILEEDPNSPAERYEFMAAGDRDPDDAPGDKRFLMSTGPFHMAPGDTARVVLGIMFAYGRGQIPNGTFDDMEKILAVDRFAQQVYDQNFLAPTPPARANLDWRPLDGGVELTWDETSERSVDVVENGLDFAGYLIQRQRVPTSAFTPTDTLEGWNLGWKTIARIDLPTFPNDTVRLLASRNGSSGALGAWWRVPFLMDTCTSNPRLFCFAFNPYDDRSTATLREIYQASGRGDLVAKYEGRGGREAELLNQPISQIVRDAIVAIVDSITGGHRYVDVGDDNGDNRIVTDETDLSKNERLINNINYEYRLLAFDAGLASEGTTPKLNEGVFGINHIQATPEAPPPTRGIEPFIVSETGLGGISDFRFMVLDQDRLGQLFGGDTLEFEFRPLDLYPLTGSYYTAQVLFYMHEIIVRRRSDGRLVTRFIVPYIFNNRFAFSDRGENLDLQDTVYRFNPDLAVPFAGTFTADPNQPYFGTSAVYKNTFAIAFDYLFTQYGDSLRFGRFRDSASRDNPFTRQSAGNTNLVGRTQYTSASATPLPSIGQIRPEVEFLPGGTETITTTKQGKTYVFENVPYLTIRVKNVAAYTREVIDPTTGQPTSVTTNYDYEFPMDPNSKIYGDTSKTGEVLTRLIAPGSYGLYAYGWLNLHTATPDQRRSPIRRASFTANSPIRPLGTPGRYYLGPVSGVVQGTSETATLEFTHRLLVNGAEILIDQAGMASVETQFNSRHMPETPPTRDFAVGDKFTVDFTGGVAGLPQPGAKVLVAIPDPKPEIISAETGRNYSSEMLDQIRVVPNPYLISHVGQRANSASELYFTRLPEKCTIEIYTEAGEQLAVIEHEASPDGRRAVNAWDLITKAGRKSASQLLIARITTPSGAETIKKFAIVVGGFRVVN